MLEDATARRNLYLVHRLMHAELQPLWHFSAGSFKVHETKRKFDKVPLDCLHIEASGNFVLPWRAPDFCVNPSDKALRVILDDPIQANVARNVIGSFHETNVAMDLQIAYANRTAITGHITALQTWDPVAAPVALIQTADKDALSVTVAGKVINASPPEYPRSAKASGGIVVLNAHISKTGTIEALTLISGTQSIFNAAAMEAVRRWTYTPFTRDGQPVEVEITIIVNFGSNAG